jgi:hypothetical protein
MTPGYSPALSSCEAVLAFGRARLGDADFRERVVRRGWISREQLESLGPAMESWAANPGSVIGVAECTATAWKP